jgi:hypothetical protein
MSDLTNSSDASSALFDSHLSAEDLATIALNHPNLWARVAWHQNAYSELLDFLMVNGDASVVDAVKTRRDLLGEPTTSGPHLPSGYHPPAAPGTTVSGGTPSATDLLGNLDSLFNTPLAPRTPAPTSALGSPVTPVEAKVDPFDRLFPPTKTDAAPTPATSSATNAQSANVEPASESDTETTGKVPLVADVAEKPLTRSEKKAAARQAAQDAKASLPTHEDAEAAETAPESSGKKVGIIALVIALVAAAVVAGYFLFFNDETAPWKDDKTPLTQGQFATFVLETFPAEARVAPLPPEDGRQNFASCDAQANVFPYALLRADPDQGQGISFRLFDNAEHAELYASQIPTCWRESGRDIPDFKPTTTAGVIVYEMTYDKDYVTYFAVYHNVFVFANHPLRWEPFAEFANGTFKTAVDNALAADPSASPTYVPPVPPQAPTTAPQPTEPSEPAESQPAESAAPEEPEASESETTAPTGTETP